MHIALIGGTGNVGRRLRDEARRRGHTVTLVARHADPALDNRAFTFVKGDVTADPATVGSALRDCDVLISAARFATVDAKHVLAVARAAGIDRLLVVGGAAPLEIAPGQRLLDSPDFPEAYKAEATAGAVFLDTLRKVDDIDWTFLSPAALFEAGERTGTFRLGGDTLLRDANGHSRISFEDYAIAMLDEVEQPAHVRQRFSVAY